MDLTPDQLRAFQIFFPYAFRRHSEMRLKGTRFVHYTSAEAAFGMIKNREVWMRKSSVMNDFMEIEYGLECLRFAYNPPNGDSFRLVLEKLFPGIMVKLEDLFNGWLPHIRSDTYLTCISEHENDEDDLGRLSMWRAYGGSAGVAIVLNPNVFFSPSDALKAYTNPVAYLSHERFRQLFNEVTDSIEENGEFVVSLGRDAVLGYIFEMMLYATLCTKHPGFHEEREWRIVYTPAYRSSERILREHMVIRGTPQPICKLPLENIPDEGLVGASIPDLINRVIIGPTNYPAALRETVIALLADAGVADAGSMVWVSDIPLRTS